MPFILALLLASEPSAKCLDDPCVDVEITAPFLLGTTPALPFFAMAVHETGSIAVDWLHGVTVVRPYDSVQELQSSSLQGQLMYGLEDGRLLFLLPGPQAHYQLWSWDGNSRVGKLADADSPEALAAAVCRTRAPSAAGLKGITNVACVGNNLVANAERLEVVVWKRSRWVPTGARVGLWGLTNGAQLILTEAEFASAHEALARFSIPAIRAPKDQSVVACGTRACWALNKEREVLVIEMDAPVPQWRKIGAITGRSYPAIKLQGANAHAVLDTGESCCRKFYFLGLPSRTLIDRGDAGTR